MVARIFLIAALAAPALAVHASAGTEGQGSPLYGVTRAEADRALLTQLNPATLSPVGPSASLGPSTQPAAFSLNGSLLAVVEWDTRPSIRILELPLMHWREQVPLNLTTGTVLARWLDARRLLVFAEQPDGLRMLVLDAMANRLVRTIRIDGHLTDRRQLDVGRAHAAVLLRSRQGLGPVRVAVVSPGGSVRAITLKPILEGWNGHDIYRPSLVADESGERAFVVGAGNEPVAAIGLKTLAVSYRRPFGSRSGTSGGERITAWLGRNRFAVGGWDDPARLFGLRIVNTATWRARVLDPRTDFVCVAGHALVGHHADGTLVVFGFDGARRLTLSLANGGMPFPSVSNDRYLYLPDGDQTLIADLAAGRVLGRVPVDGLQGLLSPSYTLGAGCR